MTNNIAPPTKFDAMLMRWHMALAAVSLPFSVIVAQVDAGVCTQETVSSPGGYACNDDPYVLVFADEFDGTSLNLDLWRSSVGVPRDAETAPMWFSENNVVVTNGRLELIGRIEPAVYDVVIDWNTNPPTTITRALDFTAGEIWSRDLFDEGIYIAGCEIPLNGGYWPAFWMYGERNFPWNEPVGIPNDVIEIDVFEFWDNNPGNWHLNLHRDNVASCSTHESVPAAGMHEYALQWERHNMSWFRDDQGLTRNTPRWSTISGQLLDCDVLPDGLKLLNVDYPRLPIVPVSIGFGCGMQAGIFHNPDYYPGGMSVDYVRFYKRLKRWGIKSIENFDGWLSVTGSYNVHTADAFILGGSCLLGATNQLDLRSSDFIDLGPGMEAGIGSSFIAQIGIVGLDGPGVLGSGGSQIVANGVDRSSVSEEVKRSLSDDSDMPCASPFPNPLVGPELLLPCCGASCSYRLTNALGFMADWTQSECMAPIAITSRNLVPGVYWIEVIWEGDYEHSKSYSFVKLAE